MAVLGRDGGDSVGLGTGGWGGDFSLGSFYVLGQDGVEEALPDHSSGPGKASVGFGPWYGFFVGQDLSDGLGEDRETGRMSVSRGSRFGSLLLKGPSGPSFPALLLRISLLDLFPSEDRGFGHLRPCMRRVD